MIPYFVEAARLSPLISGVKPALFRAPVENFVENRRVRVREARVFWARDATPNFGTIMLSH